MGGDIRVAVLADVQNVYKSARDAIATPNLCYEKLLNLMTRGRTLFRAFAYLIDGGEVNHEPFVRRLRQLQFTVRRKNLIKRSDGSFKGDWDVGLAVDMLKVAEKVDVVCLASGDGDFVPAIETVQHKHSVKVEIYAFPNHVSKDLLRVADGFHPLHAKLAYEKRG